MNEEDVRAAIERIVLSVLKSITEGQGAMQRHRDAGH